MKIKDIYIEHLKAGEFALITWIDFLVNEKKTLSMNDDAKALNLYFQANHATKMNNLIHEYIMRNRSNPNWVCYDYYKKRNIF